jgi:hypothetical protein
VRWRAENKTSAARRDIEDARAKETQPPELVRGADGMCRHPSAEAERIAMNRKKQMDKKKLTKKEQRELNIKVANSPEPPLTKEDLARIRKRFPPVVRKAQTS